MKTVIIGAGYRGKALLRLVQSIPFFEVAAIADPGLKDGAGDIPEGIAVYSKGPEDYRRMLSEQRPGLAVICSPWACHIPQAEACLEAGCNVAVEIRGGKAQGEYGPVKALLAGKGRGLKVFPMENLIFRRDIMAVREMARAGLFGEIVYMEGGYHHDLRCELVDSEGVLGGTAGAGNGKTNETWRGRAYTSVNGDIYPTHSIAPLCYIGDIHSFTELSSFASKAAGLREKLGATCPEIRLGDIVSTMIRTPEGVLLNIIHDTTLPRPKGYGIKVQGTKGMWDEGSSSIYIEGRSPYEEWEPDAAYIGEFLNPLWRFWGTEAVQADQHHRGMDFIMLKAIEEDLSGTSRYPMGLDDLALWTSITPLSCRSIETGADVKF